MLKFSVRKKLSRLLAGILSAAMAMTMAPDIWLPVYAESVRNEIITADLDNGNGVIDDTELISEDILETAAEADDTQPEFEEYEFNGNKYAYFSEEIDWTSAKLKCEALGGHLAFVNSEEERQFLSSIVKTNYTALGGWDEPKEGVWTWTDGSEMTYTRWNRGEPNNGNGGEHKNHLFMFQNGTWDDGFDFIQAPFICEWDNVEESAEENYTVFSGSDLQ